ncbi:MAG TPA: efflux RND transporter periplasmic adaptor subunit [Acidimicrobiales bacterium]|nr:efflux RND transporter periplasmic adaptor subunit [Acidimicrobiales bacterium]
MVTVAAVVIVAVVLVTHDGKSATQKYLTATVQRTTVAQTIAASGSVQPAQVFSLTFGGGAAGGGASRVTEVDVGVGTQVTPGQVLARLDATNQQSALTIAQNQLSVALAKAQVPSNASSAQDATAQNASNQLAIAQARSAVASAQAALNATALTAPVAGQIQAVNVVVGLLPPNGSAIDERAGGLTVKADISERDVTSMAKGQKAQVTLPALSTTVAATVIGVPTAANQAPGNSAAAATTAVTFPVQLSLDDSPTAVLPGMSAQIVIALASHDNVLAVPTSAIQGTTGNPTVRVMRNGKPVSVPVEVGLSTESLTEIVVGLREGDVVVTGVVNATTQTPAGGGIGGGGGFTGRGGIGGGGGGGGGGRGFGGGG